MLQCQRSAATAFAFPCETSSGPTKSRFRRLFSDALITRRSRISSTAISGRAKFAKRWSNYLSFAVVRNPWDRFVAYVAFMMRDNGWFKTDPRGTMRRVLDNPQNQSAIRFRPQSDFVCDADDGLTVLRICRLERLQADFDKVCHDIGPSPFKLEVRNPLEYLPYTEYFDEDLVRQVGDRHRRDIANFGYEFGR